MTRSQGKCWAQSLLDRGKSKCKSLEAGMVGFPEQRDQCGWNMVCKGENGSRWEWKPGQVGPHRPWQNLDFLQRAPGGLYGRLSWVVTVLKEIPLATPKTVAENMEEKVCEL